MWRLMSVTGCPKQQQQSSSWIPVSDKMEVMWWLQSVCLYVCVCEWNNSKSYGWIWVMKISGWISSLAVAEGSVLQTGLTCRTHSPSKVAWSDGRRPLGAVLQFIKWTEWTLAMTCGHDDSTINIVQGLLLLLLNQSNSFWVYSR